MLSVSDTGSGIRPEILEKVFDPFFSTKPEGRGSGLGLSMVHGFAEQCGGALTIESVVGLGTTVSLWLPVSEHAAEDAMDSDMQSTEEAETPLVILAVDDDNLVLMNTAGMLEDLGHTVFQAGSATDALRMLQQSRVDMVVTDHAMPGMTGAQLADAIEEAHPGLPVIIITGFAELPPHASSRPRLDKPFRQAELARAVNSVRAPSRQNGMIYFSPPVDRL